MDFLDRTFINFIPSIVVLALLYFVFCDFFSNNILYNFFRPEFLIYSFRKILISFKNTSTIDFFLPNKVIFWKPIFKKTSYVGFYLNNSNKWK